jgi:hypothetical protein
MKEKKFEELGLRRQNWCNQIGLDSLYKETPIITPNKRTVQGDALERIELSP